MKEFEITLEVKTIARITTQAFNQSDAIDSAYHRLAHELIKAANPDVTLSDSDVGKILTVKEVVDSIKHD